MAEEFRHPVEEEFEAVSEVGVRHRSYTSPLVPDTDTHTLPPKPTDDVADQAMCARARERYTADRKSRFRRRRKRHAAMPNFIIIGGLKCGTTSIHHYLGLHPEIQMSKPKELNFFVEELNWDLGLDWYASRFDDRFKVRGESSPHYTNLPRLRGRRRADPPELPRREAALHGPRPDQADPLALGPRDRRRLRDAGAGPHPLGAQLLLHEPLQVLDAAAALPGALRPRPDRGHQPGGAADRTRGDDAQGVRLRRRRGEASPPSSGTASGRSRAPSRATNTSSWRS